jgi:hypothetical protein
MPSGTQAGVQIWFLFCSYRSSRLTYVGSPTRAAVNQEFMVVVTAAIGELTGGELTSGAGDGLAEVPRVLCPRRALVAVVAGAPRLA